MGLGRAHDAGLPAGARGVSIADVNDFERYLAAVEPRLVAGRFAAFSPPAPSGATLAGARVFHRREFVLARFGIVDAFFVFAAMAAADATPDAVRAFSSSAFELALSHKNWLPRGFGGSAVAHPVVVTRRAGAPLRDFMARHAPKHWASFEYPAVVDLEDGRLHLFTGTPIWGGIYYDAFRREVTAVAQPPTEA